MRENPTRWQDWSNLVLGSDALCNPAFTTKAGNDSTIWSAETFGLAIIAIAVWALAQPQSKAAE